MNVLTPFSFRSGELVDPRRLNANLDEAAEVSRNAHARRYLYWTEVHQLDAMTDGSQVDARTIPVVCRADRNAECIGVRLFITATDGVNWVLSCADLESWRDLTVEGDGASEATGVANGPAFDVSSTPIELVLTAAATSTISAGRVELLMRSDRHAQGQTSTPFEPAVRFDDATADDATPLNTALAAVASFASADAAVNRGVHQERITFDGGVTFTYVIPARQRRCLGLVLYAGGSGSATALLEDENPTTIASATVSPSASGVYDADAISEAAQAGSDPTDSADDWHLTITTTGTLRGCCVIFWEA